MCEQFFNPTRYFLLMLDIASVANWQKCLKKSSLFSGSNHLRITIAALSVEYTQLFTPSLELKKQGNNINDNDYDFLKFLFDVSLYMFKLNTITNLANVRCSHWVGLITEIDNGNGDNDYKNNYEMIIIVKILITFYIYEG